jgi:hypothetical protein
MRHGRLISAFKVFALATILGLLLPGQPVSAFDIPDVQPASLDQPRVNALLRRTPDGDPLTDVLFGDIFNIQAFYDTGTSGMVLSDVTADFLGVTRARFPEPAGPLVVFEDVGVGGSSTFNVSEPLYIDVAPFHPLADINNPTSASTVYDQRFGPLRVQIGGTVIPLLGGLDIFGMPAMQGKVVVMDPKPLDDFVLLGIPDFMRTWVYDPGTPFNLYRTQPGRRARSERAARQYARHHPYVGRKSGHR